MNKNKKSFDVDWIDVVVDVDHNPLELSEGGYIFFDKNQNIEQEKILYKSKMIESQTRQTIKVKSKGSKLRISGNLYKWLNGQNVDGSHSVVNLVTDTILVLKKMNLISPTDAQLNEIKKGKFELYCVHIKFDLIFDDKEISIKYLNNIKNGGRYPYRKKTPYQNGVYFGKNSKHWVLGFYHKGNELSSNKRKNLISKELTLLANRMIRKEIKIYSRKLKELNLKFGYNWFEINYLEKLFYNEFNKLEMPDFRRTAQVSTIKNKADQKFYNFVLDGTVLDFYSRTTIHRKRKDFLEKYNLEIDTLINKAIANKKIIGENIMLLNNENNNLNHVWVPKFRLTAKEVSSMLGICRDKLNRLVKEDKTFPIAFKDGNNRQSAVYFDYLEVMYWYENWKKQIRKI